ncbi:MAG: TlpA disulfide reductase family protein [Planctomycetota bacterium]|nr:TlpA disulfide reductase family protein [Planctomycetota bacterium]
MKRFFLLSTVLVFLAGCSSDSKPGKFEAAEDTGKSEELAGDKKPAWMTGEANHTEDRKSVLPGTGSLSPGVATGKQSPGVDLGKNPSTAKGGNNGNDKKTGEVVSGIPPAKNTPALQPAGTGNATVLMARLMEGYQNSQKFFKEQQQKQLSPEDVKKVYDQYAEMVAGWLATADLLMKEELRQKDRETVVDLKQLAHQTLANFGRPEHEQKLYDFGETLKDDTSNKIRKIYEFIKLQKPLADILRGKEIDEKEYFDRLDRVASFWRDDPSVYQNIEAWITQLYGTKREYFLRALEIAAKHFTQSTNTQIMSRSEVLNDRLTVARIGFDLAVTAVAEGKENSAENLMESARRLLAQPEPSAYILTQVVQAGLQLEVKGEYEISKKYYEQVGDAIKDFENQRLKDSIQRLVDNALVRYNLIGKPLQVEGMVPEIADGEFSRKPIDFSKYRGKVVVLFFWAVGNRPSLMLMRDMDKFYLANQEKDLALIGINADRDMNVISQAMQVELQKMKRKWTHLMPSSPQKLGLETAMAKRCGVDSMPFNVIVDKKGNVDSIRAYGTRLEDTVSRLLGQEVNRVFVDPKAASEEARKKAEAGKPESPKTESRPNGAEASPNKKS